MNLARSADGLTIHKQECRYAKANRHWTWADDKNMYDVIHVCEQFGYQTCLTCYPIPGTVIRRVAP